MKHFALLLFLCLAVRTHALSQTVVGTMSGAFSTPVAVTWKFSKPDATLDTNDKAVVAHCLGASEVMDVSSCIFFDSAIPAAYVPDYGSWPELVFSFPYVNSGQAYNTGALYVYPSGGSHKLKLCAGTSPSPFPLDEYSETGPYNSAVSWTIP